MLPPTAKEANNSSLAAAIVVCLLTFQLEIANCALTHPGYIELDTLLQGNFDSDLKFVRNKHVSVNLLGLTDPADNISGLTEALMKVGPMAWLPVDQPNNLLCDDTELGKLKDGTSQTDTQRYITIPSLLTRLECFTHQISLKHAEECLPRYTQKFLQNESTWGNNKYLGQFQNKITKKPRELDEADEAGYLSYLLNTDWLNSPKTRDFAVSIVRNSRRWRIGVPILDDDGLYDAYLARPCKQYVNHFKSVFTLALFEEQMFLTRRQAYNMHGEQFVQYSMAHATYSSCYAVLNGTLKERVFKVLVAA